MTYNDITTVDSAPYWVKAFSQPLREIVYGDDNESQFEIIRQHFATRNAIPDVAVRYNGRLIVGAQ